MAVEFLEERKIKSPNVNSGDHGHFTLEEPFQFESCRERFACSFNSRTKGFYFKHPQGKGRDIAEFILKVERFVKVPRYSKFAQTNRRTILWIEPCRFWRECPIKRSLLTGLLRAGIVYDSEEDNFEKALLSNESPRSHLNMTRKALLRFLCGYTKYVGPSPTGSTTLQTQGWKYFFENKDERQVREYLKHPKGKRPRINPSKLDMSEILWA